MIAAILAQLVEQRFCNTLEESANTQSNQVVIESPQVDRPFIPPFQQKITPELADLVNRWLTFPEHIRSAILALAATVKK